MSIDKKPPFKRNILTVPIGNPALLESQGQERAEKEAGIVREKSAYGKTGELNMQCDPQEKELALRIAIRGAEFMRQYGVEEDVLTAAMDIIAVHLNDRPLRLLAFALSDITDFAHDYSRIRRLINRTTGHVPSEIELKFAEKPTQTY